MADACLGLSRYRKAASASRGDPLLSKDSHFQLQDETAQLLADRQRSPAAVQAASCSEFRAAQHTSARSALLDVNGVVAAVCCHENVLLAIDMLGHECFAYYEVRLARRQIPFATCVVLNDHALFQSCALIQCSINECDRAADR